MRWLKGVSWTVGVLIVGAGMAWFAWPRPVPVDLASVAVAPMEVTIDDEARTNLRHIYTVSSPVAGTLLRISHPNGDDGHGPIHVGDAVVAGETVVAVLQPLPPSLLDTRSREELEAIVTAAEAAVLLAEAEVQRVEAVLAFSRDELARAEALASNNTISAKALQAARTDVAVNEAGLESTRAQLRVRQSERDAARARLIDPVATDVVSEPSCCIQIKAPATGIVLGIAQQSEGIVPAGTPLLQIADSDDLEIVAELLSTDAVQIKPGARVKIDGWGGLPLSGQVVRIEPNAFVKVSALGIEEQRVRTIIDLVEPSEEWSALGNNFRVIVHVSLWSTESALTVPVASLFRSGDQWAVFAFRGGRARLTAVDVGHRNDRFAEILSGLDEGEQVVLHPSDRIVDGTAVEQRHAK
jgi:HlyD family secretion protein